MEQQRKRNNVWAEIEPYCVLHIIWRNFWMVLMTAALAVMAIYLVSTLAIRPSYSCSATFAVTARSGTNAASYTNSTAERFASLLTSSNLLDTVSEDLGIDKNSAAVKAEAIKDTNLIRLTVSAKEPKLAFAMADGIMRHYAEYSQYVFSSVVLKPVRMPDIPTAQGSADNLRRNMLIAAPVGALLMAVLLGVLPVLSGTVQTTVGAKNQIDGHMLGVIGHVRKRRSLRMILSRKKSSLLISNPATGYGYAESIGQVVSQLEHAKRRHGEKVFLVTSVSENEGKSTVAVNLALSLAKKHKKVLLVDCDLRKPAIHLIFEHRITGGKTLGSLLKAELDPNAIIQALQYRKNDNLFCLFSAPQRNCSAELFSSPKLRQLIEILKKNFDFILLDSPPLGYFSDSVQLAELAHASLLVIRQDGVTALAINDAIDELSVSSSRFLGYVLNDMRHLRLLAQREGYGVGYGVGYGYGYGARHEHIYGSKKKPEDAVHADRLEETEGAHGNS